MTTVPPMFHPYFLPDQLRQCLNTMAAMAGATRHDQQHPSVATVPTQPPPAPADRPTSSTKTDTSSESVSHDSKLGSSKSHFSIESLLCVKQQPHTTDCPAAPIANGKSGMVTPQRLSPPDTHHRHPPPPHPSMPLPSAYFGAARLPWPMLPMFSPELLGESRLFESVRNVDYQQVIRSFSHNNLIW
jgi:hypothetical protein